MNALFEGKTKYLFLIPIVMLITFAFLNLNSITKLSGQLLEEKKASKQAEIDQIANFMDRSAQSEQNWSKDDYSSIVGSLIMDLDNENNIFAALYDNNLNLLTDNAAGSDAFEPNQFQAFRDAVHGKQSGWMELQYTKYDTQDIPMYVYFRWAPSSLINHDRYLLVVGVSAKSVTLAPEDWLTADMITELTATFFVNMILVALLYYFDKKRLTSTENKRGREAC